MDPIFSIKHSFSEFHPPARSKALVLVRGALGDTLMAWPFLAAIPRHFDVEALSLVGQPSSLKLLADQPLIDGIYNHDLADWAGLYLTPPRVPDRLADFVRSHQAGVVLARTNNDPAAAGLKALGLHRLIIAPSRPPAGQEVHLVDHMFACTGLNPIYPPVTIKVSPTWLAEARHYLNRHDTDPRKIIALHPGSSSVSKNWPLPNWLTLADQLHNDFGYTPLIFLGPADDHLALSWILPNQNEKPAPWLVAHNLPLVLVAGLIGCSRAYVGHDSGLTHLAAGMGIPTVALFGPTQPSQWGPRGPEVVTLQASYSGPECRWPSPGKVLAVLVEILRLAEKNPVAGDDHGDSGLEDDNTTG